MKYFRSAILRSCRAIIISREPHRSKMTADLEKQMAGSDSGSVSGTVGSSTGTAAAAAAAQVAAEQERIVHPVHGDGEYITLGPHCYKRSDLLQALGERAHIKNELTHTRAFANPVPLGLASFSLSCLVLSLVNANVRGVTNVKFLASLFIFFGGFIELFAGLLCFVTGDTYSMTVFSSFGGFWISYGVATGIDQMHSLSSYATDPTMLNNIIGYYLAGWFIFTLIVLLCAMKSSWGLFLLLFFLDITFLMLCIGYFIDNNHCKMAGGYFGILASVCGWYLLYCGIVSPDNSYVPLRAILMPNAPTV